MGNFSVNQVRHLYVASKVTVEKDVAASALDTAIAAMASGESLFVTRSATSDQKGYLYLIHKGAGGLVRSDLVPLDKIISYKKTSASELAHPLVLKKIALDATVNGGAPYAGQDYILNVLLRNYIGLGDEDTFMKFGLVHAYTGMTASQFYVRMAISLAQNIGREYTVPFKIYLGTTGTSATDVVAANVVTKDSKEASFAGTYTCIYLEQVEQDWHLGMMRQEFVNFFPAPTTITLNGDDVCWGTVTEATPVNTVKDGHLIADLEYFCMGARGDDYRMMGYPNIVKTQYMVTPSLEYDIFDLHYYDTKSNESVQKSEKTLSIVGVAGSVVAGLEAAVEAVVSPTTTAPGA